MTLEPLQWLAGLTYTRSLASETAASRAAPDPESPVLEVSPGLIAEPWRAAC